MHICTPKTTLQKLFSTFIAALSLIIATPKKIYDIVSKNIVLNVYKYFKDEAMEFRPNHPQRSYVKKTPEATGLPQRTISVLDMLHVEPHVFYDKFLCCSSEIHYAMFYSTIFHGCKKGNFKMKNCDLFLIFAQNIDCGYSLRVPTIFVL